MIQLSPCLLLLLLTPLLPEHTSPWFFCEHCLCRLLFSFTFLAKFSSICALAYWILSLHVWTASLYCSLDMCPCFHCLYIFFLSLRPAGPCTSLQSFLSPQFLILGNGELLHTLKGILKVFLALLHSFLHKDRLLGDLI